MVSAILIAREVSHSIQVGVRPDMHPQVSCRIDLQLVGIEGNSLSSLNAIIADVQASVPQVDLYISRFPNVGAYIA